MELLRNRPLHWKTAKLGEIGTIASGGTPSTKEKENFYGNIAWITPADLTNYSNKYISKGKRNISVKGLKNSSARLLPKGTVLFSSRAPIGYVVIAANEITTNQGFKNLIPKDYVFNEYIYFYLKSAKRIAEGLASGTTFKEISAQKFAQIPIPLPPLPEQHLIVAKIEELFSELDNAVENLKKAKEQLKVYRQALLKWAFEGKLTNNKAFQIVTLGSVIESPKYGTSKKCEHKTQGLGVLRIPNIVNGFVDTNDLKFAAFKQAEIETYTLNEGDLLTIRSNGSINIVGKCALITKKECNFLFAGYLIRLRPLKEKINSKFLLYVLSSHNLRIQIESKAKSTSGVNNINSDEIKCLEIPLPALKEQQAIVDELESKLTICDKTEENISQSLQQAETLKQSILKKAFEGNLITYNL
jgi:type I restriction enzyme, S subunit